MSLPQSKATPAETLFDAALARIESESIKAWANSARNRPVWLRYATAGLETGKLDACKLATIILCNAIGL